MQKRKANMNDISTLVDLRKKQLIDEGYSLTSDVDKQFRDYFIAAIIEGSFVSWVMEVDGDIVATSGVCFYSLPPTFSNPTGRIAYITNMYTKDEYRRKGIATELLNMVLDEARMRGYKSVRLHTSEQGKSIYQRTGFVDMDGNMALRL